MGLLKRIKNTITRSQDSTTETETVKGDNENEKHETKDESYETKSDNYKTYSEKDDKPIKSYETKNETYSDPDDRLETMKKEIIAEITNSSANVVGKIDSSEVKVIAKVSKAEEGIRGDIIDNFTDFKKLIVKSKSIVERGKGRVIDRFADSFQDHITKISTLANEGIILEKLYELSNNGSEPIEVLKLKVKVVPIEMSKATFYRLLHNLVVTEKVRKIGKGRKCKYSLILKKKSENETKPVENKSQN